MIYAVLALLLVLSAFFSSLETGLLALGEVKIRDWASSGMKELGKWISGPAGIITGILIGNNLVNIVFSSLFTILVVRTSRVSASLIETVSIALSSMILLTFGEILPKTFANSYPDRIVRMSYRPFSRFYRAAQPAEDFLNRISFSMVGGLGRMRERSISRRELSLALEDIEQNDLLDRENSRMLGRVLSLTKKTVGDIMVPRKNIYAVNLKWDYGRIISSLLRSRFSRIPAYSGHPDNFSGFIYIKDVIGELNRNGEIDFKGIVRPAYVTYPGRNCHHLFQDLRRKRTHCALVKSGRRLVGLVSIEDIIEEIFGEIYDEYDRRGAST